MGEPDVEVWVNIKWYLLVLSLLCGMQMDSGEIASSAGNLSKQFCSQYQPYLNRTSSKLKHVVQSQNVLQDSLKQEHTKIKETAVNEVQIAMTLVNHYRFKLQRLSKEMAYLQERSKRLRKVSEHLLQLKQKETFKMEEQRQKKLEEEQKLVAQVVTSKND